MWSLECRHFPLSAGHDTNGNSSVTMLPVLTAAHLIHPIPWVTGWTTAHTALSKIQEFHKLMYFTNRCIILWFTGNLRAWQLWTWVREGHMQLFTDSSVWDSESVGVGMQSTNNSSTVCSHCTSYPLFYFIICFLFNSHNICIYIYSLVFFVS